MSYKPYYISSFENDSGINTYYEPFLIPEKAFPKLEDAWVFRGRVLRRKGYSFLGRLTRAVTLNSPANIPVTASPYVVADILSSVRATEPRAELKPTQTRITIDFGGANPTIFDDNGLGGWTYVSGIYTADLTTSTISYISGAITLNFTVAPPGGLAVRIVTQYFPSLPVMGIRTWETGGSVNEELTICFDTKYAYAFNNLTGIFLNSGPIAGVTFTGDDYQFFWTCSFFRLSGGDALFWATNNFDPIRYYTTALGWVTPTLNTFSGTTPPIGPPGVPLQLALVILPYKGRLVVMNTQEDGIRYPQRVRWSQIGNPTLADSWWSDTPGYGGFVDLPTAEQIVTAEFIKDSLIIKCERSSWNLTYTGDRVYPFLPRKINTELGAESSFSVVPFDRGVFTVGNYGITTDDSVNVSRIDQKIPQLVFNINNLNRGPQRVYGIRDYNNQLVYWTFPNSADNPKFPNKILVYNYVNETWAIWNDFFTCFGYLQYDNGTTWAGLPYASWAEWNDPWGAGQLQALFPNVAAGNNQGFILGVQSEADNAPFYAIISAVRTFVGGIPRVRITTFEHNFGPVGNLAYIIIDNCIGPTVLNDKYYQIVVVSANIFDLKFYNPLSGLFVFFDIDPLPTYLGGGTIQPLNNINITTKVFAPYYQEADQCRVGYVDYLFDRTGNGELLGSFFINEQSVFPVNTIDPSNSSNLGTAIIETRPGLPNIVPGQQNQNKIWIRQFIQAICQNFQITLTLTPEQMVNYGNNSGTIQASNIVLHALVLYIDKNARLTQ
jgi:hypothetical protein